MKKSSESPGQVQHRARCLNSAILLSLCSMWWRMLSENACVFKLYTPHTPHLHAPGRMGQREAAAATARLWLRVRTATLQYTLSLSLKSV